MSDAGFFRGTSAEQDNRFSNKDKKLMKEMKFSESLTKKVDMSKVKLEVIKPWVTERITAILGMEDDVIIDFIFNQLDAEKTLLVYEQVSSQSLPLRSMKQSLISTTLSSLNLDGLLSKHLQTQCCLTPLISREVVCRKKLVDELLYLKIKSIQ